MPKSSRTAPSRLDAIPVVQQALEQSERKLGKGLASVFPDVTFGLAVAQAAKQLRIHLAREHGLKLKKAQVLQALGASLGHGTWAEGEAALRRAFVGAQLEAAQDEALFAVAPAVECLDADKDTLVVGCSGVGKTTALAEAMVRTLCDSECGQPARPVLVLLDRSIGRDGGWDKLSAALQTRHGANFGRFDESEGSYATSRAAMVFSDSYSGERTTKTTRRIQAALAWTRQHLHERPVLVMDEPKTVFRDALGQFMSDLPYGVTAVWAAPTVRCVEPGDLSRFKRIVAMTNSQPDRELEQFMLKLRHPQPIEFAARTLELAPRMALTFTSPRAR